MPKTFPIARIKCARIAAIVVASLGLAQDAALHIKIIAGDGANYSLGAHAAKPLTVEVADATGRPVSGARVSFQVPESGPGGLFANGLRTDIVVTDSNGRATAHGLQCNRAAGSFAIRVTAAKDLARAGTIARQFIGGAGDTTEGADRKAPPATPVAKEVAKKEPGPAPPQGVATAPPTILAPGTTATSAVKPATELQPAPARAVAPSPHDVPTIIVTEKSSKSIVEIGADRSHRSHRKWILLGILAAGGAGAAFATTSMGSGGAHSTAGSGAAAGLSSAVSIGTPTFTIGKP